MCADEAINPQAHIPQKQTTAGSSSNGRSPCWSVFLCLSWLWGRPDQMVLESCSWEVQSNSWHLQTNLQYTSILSGSAELPRSHPQVAVLLYVRVCVRSCSKGSSSTVTDSTWATSPTKRSVWRQDTAGPGGSTTLTTWDRFACDAHTLPSHKQTCMFSDFFVGACDVMCFFQMS